MFEQLRQYSAPLPEHDERIDGEIVGTHAKGICHALIENPPVGSRPCPGSLTNFLLGGLDLPNRMETFWDVAFGRIQRCLETSTIDVVDAMSLAAFQLAKTHSRGTCEATLSKPLRLRWDHLLLPPMDEFRLETSGADLELSGKLNGEKVFTLHRAAAALTIDGVAQSEVDELFKLSDTVLLSGDAVLDDVVLEDEFHAIFGYPIIENTHKECLAAGFEVLHALPHYATWVHRVIRGILVCETLKSRTRSSSWSEAPGIVLVSLSDQPHLIAEMLVHEASHQYYNLLTRLGESVTNSEKDLYYSPAVQRPRPLKKLLLGYHAFANMQLFYRSYLDLLDGGPTEIQMRYEELTAKLDAFEQPLARTENLTTIGKALFLPVYERTKEVRSAVTGGGA